MKRLATILLFSGLLAGVSQCQAYDLELDSPAFKYFLGSKGEQQLLAEINKNLKTIEWHTGTAITETFITLSLEKAVVVKTKTLSTMSAYVVASTYKVHIESNWNYCDTTTVIPMYFATKGKEIKFLNPDTITGTMQHLIDTCPMRRDGI